MLMSMGLEKNDFGPLTKYYRKITWGDKVVRLNRGFLNMLILKASEFGYKKELSDVLGKFFLTNGFRELIENEIDKRTGEMDEKELENIKAAFKNTVGEKELKLFIDIRIMEKEFAVIEDWDSYASLTENLKTYADMTVEFQQKHDSWLLEEKDEKPLNQATILGQGILQFYELADKEYAAALKTLKNLFGVRPSMTTALSELSRLYTTRIKVLQAKEADEAKFAEMYQLEESLLNQIAALDANGRTDEALATYTQLTTLLQNTYGVDTLHV
jgi:hypothetical protein